MDLFDQTLDILISKLVDFFSIAAESIWTMVFASLTSGVFLTVVFYFLKIGEPLLLNSCGLFSLLTLDLLSQN